MTVTCHHCGNVSATMQAHATHNCRRCCPLCDEGPFTLHEFGRHIAALHPKATGMDFVNAKEKQQQ